MIVQHEITSDEQDRVQDAILIRTVDMASQIIAKMFIRKYGKKIVKGMSMAQVFKGAKDIAAKELADKLK